MKNHHTPRITGLSLAVLLALTACGGSNGNEAQVGPEGDVEHYEEQDQQDQGSHIYEFDQARVADSGDAEPYYAADGEPVTVQLSEELAGTVPAENPLAVESYTVASTSFDTGLCRVDIEVHYADGGLEALQERVEYTGVWEISSFLIGKSVDEVVDSVPADEELSGPGVLITEDSSNIVITDECSDDAEDDLFDLAFYGTSFPNDRKLGDEIPLEEQAGETDTEVTSGHIGRENNAREFATVELSVLADGAITVLNPDVAGAEVGVTGDWAPAEGWGISRDEETE